MPAIMAAINENINAGTIGNLIEKIRSEITKPNAAAKSVEKAIKPK